MRTRRVKARILAICLIAAMLVGVLGASIATFAATATVQGSSVNVRQTASTSSSVVGTVNSGDTFDVGDPETGSDGQQWYKITLSNGQAGYVRSDFLNIQQEEAPAEEVPAEQPVEQPAAVPADNAPADTATSSDGKYQIVNVPDENGDVWYVYDYAEGLRIKIDDLAQFDTIREQAETNKAAASRMRTLMIIFAVLALLLLVAAALLLLRLRDATSSDVDLMEQRRRDRQRNRNADDVSSISSRGAGQRARNRAYPSGQNPAGGAARRPGARQQEAGAARPAQRGADGQPMRRPAQRGEAGAERQVRPQQQEMRRPVQGAQQPIPRAERPMPAQQQQRPMQQPGAPVQQQRPMPQQRPQPMPQRQPSQAETAADATQVRKPVQPRNFAVDDDMDYEFLNNGKN